MKTGEPMLLGAMQFFAFQSSDFISGNSSSCMENQGIACSYMKVVTIFIDTCKLAKLLSLLSVYKFNENVFPTFGLEYACDLHTGCFQDS